MPVASATDARAARLLDVVGVVLAVALAVWTDLVAGGGDGRSTPVLLLLVALVAAVAIGRRLSASPHLVPRAAAAAEVGALALTYPGLLIAPGLRPGVPTPTPCSQRRRSRSGRRSSPAGESLLVVVALLGGDGRRSGTSSLRGNRRRWQRDPSIGRKSRCR